MTTIEWIKKMDDKWKREKQDNGAYFKNLLYVLLCRRINEKLQQK